MEYSYISSVKLYCFRRFPVARHQRTGLLEKASRIFSIPRKNSVVRQMIRTRFFGSASVRQTGICRAALQLQYGDDLVSVHFARLLKAE